MRVSDTLSRAYISSGSKSKIEKADMTHYVHFIMQHLPVSDSIFKHLQSETASDPTLQKSREYTINGWPLKPDIEPFFYMYNA